MRSVHMLFTAWLGCLAVLTPTMSYADLFDTARQAIRTDLGRADTSGVSIRGGVGLATGQQPGTTTLLRGQASTGGTCGSFDFKTSITQAFEELPGMFEALLGEALQELPMLVLCYTSPSVCDLAKHFQSLVNFAVQAKYAQCQQIQQAMSYGGARLRGGTISQCLEDEANAGHSISVAMKTCTGSAQSVRGPDGTNRVEVNLVQDTLAAAGVSTETQTLAKSLLGEITLRANDGQLASTHSTTQAALLARYETHRQSADTALRTAVQEVQATGTISDATLRAVSAPGQPLPRVALDALVALQKDQLRSESMIGKLSTGLAITTLTWECTDLQAQLTAATDANSHLTDEERRLLERRYQSLRQDLAAVMAKKDATEKHLQPAIDALLSEYTAVQSVATKAGLRAPTVTSPPMPYQQQAPSGYSQ
jgi:hypothetical protein